MGDLAGHETERGRTDLEVKTVNEISAIIQEIRSVLEQARRNTVQQVNCELLNTYWNIGHIKDE